MELKNLGFFKNKRYTLPRGLVYVPSYFIFPLLYFDRFYNCALKSILVGRNIALSPDNPKNKAMLTIMGHSYLIIIPNNPAQVRQGSALYKKYETALGCNKRGIVIGAYPSKGTTQIGDLDGYLEAQINAERERIPTAHFLCGTSAQKKRWDFVSGLVEININETKFINNLLERALAYQYVTKFSPVDYHAVRSTIDAVSVGNSLANNCNSFAFSLLAYSDAFRAPDIGANRVLPGNRHLLPQYLFFKTSVIQPQGFVPSVVKNDTIYKRRVEAARKIREGMELYQNSKAPI